MSALQIPSTSVVPSPHTNCAQPAAASVPTTVENNATFGDIEKRERIDPGIFFDGGLSTIGIIDGAQA